MNNDTDGAASLSMMAVDAYKTAHAYLRQAALAAGMNGGIAKAAPEEMMNDYTSHDYSGPDYSDSDPDADYPAVTPLDMSTEDDFEGEPDTTPEGYLLPNHPLYAIAYPNGEE